MKITIEIPPELEKYVPSDAKYFENLIIQPLAQKYRTELEAEVLKKEKTAINNQLQDARQKINIKREDKAEKVENGTFPDTYTPPSEGKGEREKK
jgi:hypothetical protein